MKRFVLLTATVIFVSVLTLCSCTAEYEGDKVDTCYTSSCTMSEAYDKQYDQNIVGTFSVDNYTDKIDGHSQKLEADKETISAQKLRVYLKNYGQFNSSNFAKYAAVEVFDQLSLGRYSPDDLKVYKDETTGTWMVKNISLEALKKTQHNVKADDIHTVIFNGEGHLLCCWTEKAD